MKIPVVLHWSSGKDAALALHRLQRDGQYEVVQLITTVSQPYDRVVMHGVRRELLEAQASAIGLPLRIIPLPPSPGHAVYEAAMSEAYGDLRAAGIATVAFGDIFLEDLRAYREEGLERAGMDGLFPLWKEDTRSLVREMTGVGIRATVIAVDASRLGASFLGREVDEDFMLDLPEGIDPCGERGEFHTFVWDAPSLQAPIRIVRGETVHRTYDGEVARDGQGFYFLDLLPEHAGTEEQQSR